MPENVQHIQVRVLSSNEKAKSGRAIFKVMDGFGVSTINSVLVRSRPPPHFLHSSPSPLAVQKPKQKELRKIAPVPPNKTVWNKNKPSVSASSDDATEHLPEHNTELFMHRQISALKIQRHASHHPKAKLKAVKAASRASDTLRWRGGGDGLNKPFLKPSLCCDCGKSVSDGRG
ncbi:hypothetical protein MKZ38_003370 [Zalerion maritima]|uniref:Uncharacterized protein n=1 Tax=Zalerion maritima TaxID=339359 RepID=A0AAD5RMW4_9PEZI|nr:hypothetical protein MKZ38_003370 [Zalerion maritima]